ncbi:MAG: biotin transporter BioY [Ruminococcus sp.]|uniref:biotin transporter BioY n=1 Tax=Ruminococcus sp. TaxID=41978 RepID=UPI002873ACDE|nr:biotin transporter BioY [Ruminococcus sp.]MBQ3284806.1 biotin transporter BioY [Ruminococcus sp.]
MSGNLPDSKKTHTSVKDMAYVALFAALIAVCSIISIPVGTVPVTLQTFGVCLCAAMLGWKRGTLSVLIYILLGAVGAPVFAGMKGGFGVLAGPTGGYIVGFLLSALIIGIAAQRWERKALPLTVAMILGVLACYLVGTVWFMIVTKMPLGESLLLCVVPFLLPDAVKIAAAVILSNRLSKVVKL